MTTDFPPPPSPRGPRAGLFAALLGSVVVYLALAMWVLGLWLRHNFGELSFDQVVFTATVSTTGLFTGDEGFLWRGAAWTLLAPIPLTLVERSWLRTGVGQRLGRRWMGARAVLAASGLIVLAQSVGLPAAVRGIASSKDYFGANYVPPETLRYDGSNATNLVTIYVESMENAYGEERLFGRDLLAPYRRIAQPTRSFRYLQHHATGFTIGAQVATQCSVPLFTLYSRFDGNTQGENAERFLPGAHCLGDVLENLGYRNVVTQGASLLFAGQGKFWKEHGYSEVYGSDELRPLGYTEVGTWGMTDDSVLAHARTVVRRLHGDGQPFNLTIVLLDTHHPDGILSPTCAARGARGLDQIVECTSEMVTTFVEELGREGILANTRVVIVGDHLAMPNTLRDRIDQVPERQVFNLWIGGDERIPLHDTMLHYDFLASVLDFIGVRASREKIGLGRSVFSAANYPSRERVLRDMNEQLIGPTPSYRRLWW